MFFSLALDKQLTWSDIKSYNLSLDMTLKIFYYSKTVCENKPDRPDLEREKQPSIVHDWDDLFERTQAIIDLEIRIN